VTMEAVCSMISRLPVAPPPVADERLSSWLARLAELYGATICGLLGHFGMRGTERGADFHDNLEWRLGERDAASISVATGQSLGALRAMTFAELRPRARPLIARQGRRVCPDCAGGPVIARKSGALPWVFWCPIHGSRLRPLHGPLLADRFSGEVLERLDPFARDGAAWLRTWASEGDEDEIPNAPSLVGLLEFLTTSYRRPSPPTLAEIPGASLRERMFHEALRRPIARQALALVVPEYDRAAPVLAKAAAPGLAALARGSPLQSYALAAGLGRLIANPVAEAAKVLAASDAEGRARLNESMRSWPGPLRRRIGREARRAAARPPSAPALGRGGSERFRRPDAAPDDSWGRLAQEVVAEAAPRLPGLGLDASLGVLMRSAQERLRGAGGGRKRARVAPVSKTPAELVSTTPTQSH